MTVKLIIDHYRWPASAIDISPGLFAGGRWGKALMAVEGEPVSLDDIEHRILRPICANPRIHYGVNCASLGCAPTSRHRPSPPWPASGCWMRALVLTSITRATHGSSRLLKRVAVFARS